MIVKTELHLSWQEYVELPQHPQVITLHQGDQVVIRVEARPLEAVPSLPAPGPQEQPKAARRSARRGPRKTARAKKKTPAGKGKIPCRGIHCAETFDHYWQRDRHEKREHPEERVTFVNKRAVRGATQT